MKPVEKKQAAGMLKQMIDNHNCIIEAINKDYPIIYEGMPNEVCVSDIVEWVETQTKMKTQAELIDKACELLSVNLVHLGLFTNESIADFIINFKNAMGGGIDMKQEEIRVEVRLKEFCSRHGRNYSDFSINSEGTVDCKTDVVISGDDLIEGKLPFKFGKVEGFFSCKFLNIISLEGSPREVDGDFDCMVCDKLTSLKGAPQIVGGDFWCSECKNLKLLEGAPQKVGGYFYCTNCGKKFYSVDEPEGIVVNGDFIA